MTQAVIGVDRVVPFSSIQRQVCIAQSKQKELERQWVKNREAARQDPDFDITKHFGHLYERFGIEGFGLG